MENGKSLRRQLFIIIVLLATISIVFIYSSSFTVGIRKFNNGHYFLTRQIIWYIIGFIAMIVVSNIDYLFLRRIRAYLLILGIIILISVLVFGIDINGARRWLRVGGLSVQPAEFSKLFFIIWFAGLMQKFKEKNLKDFDILIPSILMLILYSVLIFLERDLSTALHLCVVIFILLVVSKVSLRYIFGFIFSGIFMVAIFIGKSSMRWSRMTEYFNGIKNLGVGGGYQVVQSVIGIGNGGFIGAGYGKGLQKYFYLPELHTDFIFSVIAEEMGFLMGSIPIIALYVWFMIIGVKIINKSKDYYAKYLALGITSLVVVQALINLMVVSGMIPATGIPLPFVSSGGSSIVTLMIAMGILFNISKKGEE